MSVRSFIAIEIPEEIKLSIQKTITQVKDNYREISWTKSSAYHLTLKFLGEVDENLIKPIGDRLEEIAEKYTSFSLTVSGLGMFPNKNNPRVLWAGLKLEDDELLHLQKDIESGLAQLGFEKEDAFKISFIISLPAVLAAIAFDLLFEGALSGLSFDVFLILQYLVVMALVAVIGYLMMDVLLLLAKKVDFSIICYVLGGVTIGLVTTLFILNLIIPYIIP